MSHFSKLKIQIKDQSALHKVLFLRGLTSEKIPQYRNSYSGEVVDNATVVKNASGKTLMVVDTEGNVIVDAFFMGHEYDKILQEYAKETILSSAVSAGGWVSQESVDNKTGDLIVEVCFN